jgi:hypothetical protein
LKGLAEAALACVPRALGLEDREAGSKTYGCFDRAHWHYQLADFPSAWFQTGSLLLALAWASKGTAFSGKEKVRAWARAGVSFLLASAHRDGSLAEVYPFERSYCATAFAALHASEALAILGEPAPPELARVARFLAGAKPTDAANQVAAAAAALAGVARLSGDEGETLARAADARLDDLLRMQSQEGFFLEYGGADPGYQSVTLSCLAHLARSRKEREPAIAAAAAKGADALRNVVREDGTYEWRTTRRRTQFLYPLGLVRWAPDLAARFRKGLEQGRVIEPSWLDDRYFLHLAADFLFASREERS